MLNNKDEKIQEGRYHRNGHYDPRFREQVVQEIIEGLPRRAAIVKYGVNARTLSDWLYASDRYKATPKGTSAVQKRSVVRAIGEGRMTIKEAMVIYKIANSKTIRKWIEWENQENNELAGCNQETVAKKTSKKNTDIPSSAQELAALRQALADEKLKNAALNTLIDVAEEQLKINIRKKPGARPS